MKSVMGVWGHRLSQYALTSVHSNSGFRGILQNDHSVRSYAEAVAADVGETLDDDDDDDEEEEEEEELDESDEFTGVGVEEEEPLIAGEENLGDLIEDEKEIIDDAFRFNSDGVMSSMYGRVRGYPKDAKEEDLALLYDDIIDLDAKDVFKTEGHEDGQVGKEPDEKDVENFSEEQLKQLADDMDFDETEKTPEFVADLFSRMTVDVLEEDLAPEMERDRVSMLDSIVEMVEHDVGNLTLGDRYGFAAGGRPMLSRRVKQEMFELNRKDPKRWDLDALAHKFQMRKPRINAILNFMRTRAAAEARGERIDTTVEDALAEHFGEVDRMPDKLILSDVVQRRQKHGHLPEDYHQPIVTELIRKAQKLPPGLDLKKWRNFELPVYPPQTIPTSLTQSRPMEPLRKLGGLEKAQLMYERKSPRYVVEKADGKTGLHVSNATRSIMVVEPDGKRRTADWKERHRWTKALFAPRLRRAEESERRLFAGEKSFLEDPTFTHPEIEELARHKLELPRFDDFRGMNDEEMENAQVMREVMDAEFDDAVADRGRTIPN